MVGVKVTDGHSFEVHLRVLKWRGANCFQYVVPLPIYSLFFLKELMTQYLLKIVLTLLFWMQRTESDKKTTDFM